MLQVNVATGPVDMMQPVVKQPFTQSHSIGPVPQDCGAHWPLRVPPSWITQVWPTEQASPRQSSGSQAEVSTIQSCTGLPISGIAV
jgi:hypothetical protein